MGILPGFPISTELPDVKLIYKCIDQWCDIGQTKADQGYYRLRTLLPQSCGGAFITAEKEGYLSQTEQIRGSTLTIDLPKLKRLGIDVIVHEYDSSQGAFVRDRDLRDGEKVYISLRTINETLDQYTEWPSENTLDLIEGNYQYNIDIQLMKSNESIGGYKADAYEFDYLEFADANKIVFHVFDYQPRDTIPMFEYFFEGTYREELKPTFR